MPLGPCLQNLIFDAANTGLMNAEGEGLFISLMLSLEIFSACVHSFFTRADVWPAK